jgi:hypothetical protein
MISFADSFQTSPKTEQATLDTFISDWPCLSVNSDAETQSRVKSAIRRSIVDASKNTSDPSEALSILFQTRLTATHRIALFDGLSRLSGSVVKDVSRALNIGRRSFH